jgi:hypothetical protein
MTNNEIIQALKENTSAFSLMPNELQEMAEKIGWGKPNNILWKYYYEDNWKICAGFGRFSTWFVYQLNADYQPEPEFEKYMVELFNFGKMKGLAVCLGGLPLSIAEAATAPNFSHFETGDGNKIGFEAIATYIAPKDKGGCGGKVFVVMRKQ